MTQPPQNPQTGGAGYYGTSPYQAPQPVMAGPAEEPSKVKSLKTFTLISLAIYLVQMIPTIILFTNDSFFASVMAEGYTEGGLTADDMATVLSITKTIAIISVLVSGLIGLGLYLLVYFPLRKDKNWARILGIIFASISCLSALGNIPFLLMYSSVGGGMTAVLIICMVASLAVNVYWLILAFNKETAAWFSRPAVPPFQQMPAQQQPPYPGQPGQPWQ